MKVDGKDTRPIWLDPESHDVNVIDQRALPHELVVLEMQTVDDAIFAIKEMVVRGAPLIGITGAYGVYLALKNAPAGRTDAAYLQSECERIRSARPTAPRCPSRGSLSPRPKPRAPAPCGSTRPRSRRS